MDADFAHAQIARQNFSYQDINHDARRFLQALSFLTVQTMASLAASQKPRARSAFRWLVRPTANAITDVKGLPWGATLVVGEGNRKSASVRWTGARYSAAAISDPVFAGWLLSNGETARPGSRNWLSKARCSRIPSVSTVRDAVVKWWIPR